jgi:hypothetical protein
MSNENESTIKMTPPIRRVAADASLSIPLDNHININEEINRSSISMKKVKKASYNLVKQSRIINNNNNESSTVLRERSTSSSSSSSKSSINDSLKSFSPDPSLNQDDDDDDDASSNDETNHQWNLNEILSNPNFSIRQSSKSSCVSFNLFNKKFFFFSS